MFRSTKISLSAILAIGAILSLAVPAHAATLANGVYFANLRNDNNQTADLYYAPFSGTGIGAATEISPSTVSGQINDIQVVNIGGTGYLYYSGYNSSNTYRATANGAATMGAATVINGSTDQGGNAVDAVSTIPQVYYPAGGSGTVYKINADGSGSQTTALTAPFNAHGITLSTTGSTNSLFVGSQDGSTSIQRYDFPTNGSPGSSTTYASNTTGVNDIAYDPSSDTLYWITGNGDPHFLKQTTAGGSPTSVGTGSAPGGGNEIKEIALDTVSNRLYFSDQVNSVDYVDLSDNSIHALSTGLSDDTYFGIGAIFVVDQQQQNTGVPEPSTFVLAALGLAGLGLVAWRKRRSR